MREILNNIRTSDKTITLSRKILNTILILGLGIALGVFSKWLDNTAINDAIWWTRILGALDLRNRFSEVGVWIFLAVCISVYSGSPFRAALNVFVFFVGMTISYHLYTIFFSGFNPSRYMMIWYTITLFTPFLAFVCWYAKGRGKISFVLDVGILAVMLLSTFIIYIWYIGFRSVIDTLLFVGTVIVLYMNPKKSAYSLLGALVCVFVFKMLV